MFCEQIEISKKEKDIVQEFCEKLYKLQQKDGSRDVIRNDTGSHRLIQGLIGKFGEVGASKVIGGNINFTIWEKNSRKGDFFDPDIIETHENKIKLLDLKNKRLHVKTCGTQHAIKLQKRIIPTLKSSWTIDISDPIYRNPTMDDIIILMFSSPKADVFYVGYVYAYEVQNLWKPCLNPILTHKKAIYYEDIKKFIR